MFSKSIILFALFTFFIPASGYSTGRDLVEAGHLSQEALNALIEANNSDGYKVKLLKKGGNENLQVVAIVGEKHVKTKSDSDLGKNLLANFKVRGLECVNSAESYFSVALVVTAVIVEVCLRYFSKEETERSTLQDAQSEAPLLNVTGFKEINFRREQELVAWSQSQFILPANNDQITYTIDELSAEDRIRAQYSVHVPDHREGVRVKNISLQEIFLQRGNIHSFFQWDIQKATNFWLEANHHSSVVEKIASVYYPISLGVLITSIFGLIPYVNSIFSEYSASILQASSLAIITGTATSLYLEEKSNYEWLMPKLLNPINVLVYGRNETMVKNLTQILTDYSEIKNILVLVGKKHVFGLAEILTHGHGFEAVELE